MGVFALRERVVNVELMADRIENAFPKHFSVRFLG
jgi:hypothetical protein